MRRKTKPTDDSFSSRRVCVLKFETGVDEEAKNWFVLQSASKTAK